MQVLESEQHSCDALAPQAHTYEPVLRTDSQVDGRFLLGHWLPIQTRNLIQMLLHTYCSGGLLILKTPYVRLRILVLHPYFEGQPNQMYAIA